MRAKANDPYRISIHPPREGWDCLTTSAGYDRNDFNPPTP